VTVRVCVYVCVCVGVCVKVYMYIIHRGYYLGVQGLRHAVYTNCVDRICEECVCACVCARKVCVCACVCVCVCRVRQVYGSYRMCVLISCVAVCCSVLQCVNVYV